jgi:hypothetical protein
MSREPQEKQIAVFAVLFVSDLCTHIYKGETAHFGKIIKPGIQSGQKRKEKTSTEGR